MTQLTINVDETVLARAKELAAAQKVSVEEMIERFLRVLARPPLRREDMPPNLRAVAGIAPPMTDEEVEQTLDEVRMKKYGGS
jgi:hypothetical protein